MCYSIRCGRKHVEAACCNKGCKGCQTYYAKVYESRCVHTGTHKMHAQHQCTARSIHSMHSIHSWVLQLHPSWLLDHQLSSATVPNCLGRGKLSVCSEALLMLACIAACSHLARCNSYTQTPWALRLLQHHVTSIADGRPSLAVHYKHRGMSSFGSILCRCYVAVLCMVCCAGGYAARHFACGCVCADQGVGGNYRVP
jgi:hypothetical protein